MYQKWQRVNQQEMELRERGVFFIVLRRHKQILEFFKIAVTECKNSNQLLKGTSQIVFLFDQPSSYDCKHTALLISGKSNDHHKVKINFGSFHLVMIMLLNNRNNC